MSQPYVGQIVLVGYNFVMPGWISCDGSLQQISNYDVLFNLLGTTYGGDGVTTFAVPDLRGRVPVHQGTLSGGGTYSIGQMAGAPSVTLTTPQLPAHGHALNCQTGNGNANTATGNYFAASTTEIYAVPNNVYAPMGSLVSSSGGSQPHDNMQPYLVLNYQIAAEGIYPSQN